MPSWEGSWEDWISLLPIILHALSSCLLKESLNVTLPCCCLVVELLLLLLSRFSHVWLLATPWTAAHQAPLSTGFSRQEYWSGVPVPSPSGWVDSDPFVIPWTVACQVPLSVGFPRQEYWSELPFPSPGNLPDSGIKPASPALVGRFFTTEPSGKPLMLLCVAPYSRISWLIFPIRSEVS